MSLSWIPAKSIATALGAAGDSLLDFASAFFAGSVVVSVTSASSSALAHGERNFAHSERP